MFVSNDIKKVINRHKKWNEKYEIFTFTVSYEKEEYYYILFKSFMNKRNGAMVINKKGNSPNGMTAIEVIKKLNFYNDSILYTANELTKIKDRPISVLPQTIEMLEDELLNLNLKHELANEIKEFKIMYKEMGEGQTRLKEIYENFVKVDKEVCDIQKVLTDDNYHYAFSMLIESQVILFKQSITQYQNLRTIPRIIEYLKKHSSNKKLISLLDKYIDQKKVKILKDSMDSLLRSDIGDVYSIPYNEEGYNEFRRLKELEAEKNFKEKLVPHIRN